MRIEVPIPRVWLLQSRICDDIFRSLGHYFPTPAFRDYHWWDYPLPWCTFPPFAKLHIDAFLLGFVVLPTLSRAPPGSLPKLALHSHKFHLFVRLAVIDGYTVYLSLAPSHSGVLTPQISECALVGITKGSAGIQRLPGCAQAGTQGGGLLSPAYQRLPAFENAWNTEQSGLGPFCGKVQEKEWDVHPTTPFGGVAARMITQKAVKLGGVEGCPIAAGAGEVSAVHRSNIHSCPWVCDPSLDGRCYAAITGGNPNVG
ncbi:hypothetical protein FA13DRAFT_1780799 [Coprinellus micaceus]|uniref:Uncharacterized protein n=1 Tax=Coprinellus micaceus TaxID=71717 RepID=A0A4Y7SCK5_COPMI|nr:hypothetical protein FA13DRAFT_1780799 [Coprinellus micaceus]